QVNGSVAGVQRRLDATIEPGQRSRKTRIAQRSGYRLQSGELLGRAAALQPETPDPIQVLFAQELEGETPAVVDQFPAEVLPGQAHDPAGEFRGNGCHVDKGGDEPAAPAVRLGRQQPHGRVKLSEHIKGNFGRHDYLWFGGGLAAKPLQLSYPLQIDPQKG